MSTYHPDAWVPVLIESEKYGKVYKILAGWYGGFAGADSWKLSSGVQSISVEPPTTEGAQSVLTIPQSSGSVYVVGERTHVSGLMASIFESYALQAKEHGDFTIKMIEVEELLEAFE